MRLKTTSRLDRALALRDRALRIVGAYGRVITIGGKRHAVLDAAPWRIAFSSPFGGGPTRLDPTKGLGAYESGILLQKRGGRANLDYSLSVWRGPKVLFVEWDVATPEELDVANFKQGNWEAEFLAWVAP